MRLTIFYFILFITLGCKPRSGNSSPLTGQAFNPYRVYASAIAEVNQMDTVLPSGKYIDFFLNGDTTLIMSWGSKQYGKAGAHEYGKWPVPMGIPWYQCEFDDYIAVTESCGSGLWCLTLLPVKPTDSMVVLEEDLLRDTNHGYIFARCCVNEDSTDFCLYDVNHKIHHPVKLPQYEWTGDITNTLDSFAFVKDGLFIRWNSWKENGAGVESRDTVIDLK